jgi:hypothetical protein
VSQGSALPLRRELLQVDLVEPWRPAGSVIDKRNLDSVTCDSVHDPVVLNNGLADRSISQIGHDSTGLRKLLQLIYSPLDPLREDCSISR